MQQHRGETLTPAECAELREHVERVSERKLRSYIGVSAQTIARAIGGMHVQRGTVALIRQRLSSLRGATA